MVYVGNVVLFVSFIVSIFVLILSFTKLRQRDLYKATKNLYQWVIGLFGSVTLTTLILVYGFVAKDFNFDYVANHSSADMAVFYRISALWAGHEGSLLLWLWLISLFAALIAYFRFKERDVLTGYALAVMNGVQLFFLTFLLFAANPFKVADIFISTGFGINPLLLHWAMIFHPPTLFVGYAGMTIPFAYAIAALLTGDASDEWVNRSRLWTLFTWLFLTIGIFLGAVWAYVVLGWGGYWGWDPVENASLLPWLAGIALLHSFHMYQRKRGFKIWALSMAAYSFILVIVATFITRSGLIQSVHAFEENLATVTLFALFILGIIAASAYLLIRKGSIFAVESMLKSIISRDFVYHLNNIVVTFASLVILSAAFIPAIFAKSAGPDFYNKLFQPLTTIFLFFIAICPLLSWGKTDTTSFSKKLIFPVLLTLGAAAPLFIYWRSLVRLVETVNPKRTPPTPDWLGYVALLVAVFTIGAVIQALITTTLVRSRATSKGFLSSLASIFIQTPGKGGGLITHLGIAIAVIGLVGSYMFTADISKNIQQVKGATIKATNLTLKFQELKTSTKPNRQIFNTVFDVYDGKGKKIRQISPRVIFYELQEQQTREVDIVYEPFRDIFVIFEGQNQDGTLKITTKINPLISLVWLGGILFVLGTLVALIPRRGPA